MNPIIVLLIISTLVGSSISSLFSQIISLKLPFHLFNSSIPGVSTDLISLKTLDFVDFGLTALITIIFFGFHLFLFRKSNQQNTQKSNWFAVIILAVFSIVLFLQTHFVVSSKQNLVVFIVVFEILFITFSLLKKHSLYSLSVDLTKTNSKLKYLSLANGLLFGFYLLLILNQLINIPILSVGIFLICPLIFSIFAANEKFERYVKSFPGALIVLALFSPNNLIWLLVLGILTLVVWTVIFYKNRDLFLKSPVLAILFYAAALIVIIYDPNFNIGHFDPVEEGFWLGWMQHLWQGQTLYKDVTVYYPPFLIWGMFDFSKIFGLSIFSERLYLHLLQIAGSIIYFFYLNKVLKNKVVSLIIFLLFLSFCATQVRNNVEIRIGLGLLSLLSLFYYLEKRKNWLLFLSSVLGAIAFFASIEVGIVTIAILFLGLNIFDRKLNFRNRLNKNVILAGGILTIALPTLLIIFIQGGLSGFFSQLTFYASIFSQGYFNLPVARVVPQSYFHWHLFNDYLTSDPLFWEFTKLNVIGGAIFAVYKYVASKHTFTLHESFLLITILFNLLLFRVALGRSDGYHLLFVLLTTFIILGYVLEQVYTFNKALVLVILFGLLFFFARPAVNSVYLENQFTKYQTYGKIIGTFATPQFARGAGLLSEDKVNTDDTDQLVSYIDTQTNSSDKIFTFPWDPEIYFYTDRGNATQIDEPYAFFTPTYQQQMIRDLQTNNPKIIVYNNDRNFGGFAPTDLKELNDYILANFKEVKSFGTSKLLEKK